MRQTPFDFFFEHAGVSYRPAIESEFAGRTNGAVALARAEFIAWDEGCTFCWDEESAWDCDRSGIEHDGPLYGCLMLDDVGVVIQSLGGIDFGDHISPQGQPYKRVVQAELALEHFYKVM